MFLNLVQMAESFGVSERVVERWIRYEGLPHTPDRGRLIFDRAQVAEWAAARGLATKTGFLAPQATTLGGGLSLAPLLRSGGIWRDVPPDGVGEVLRGVVAALPGVTPAVGKMLAGRLAAAGGLTMAPVGGGFALPHPAARVSLGRDSGAVALLLLREPLPDEGLHVDDVPVTRLLFFMAPSARAHLELLARLSRSLACAPLRRALVEGADDGTIHRAFEDFDAPSASGGGA